MNWHEGKWAKLTPSTKLLSEAYPTQSHLAAAEVGAAGLCGIVTTVRNPIIEAIFFGALHYQPGARLINCARPRAILVAQVRRSCPATMQGLSQARRYLQMAANLLRVDCMVFAAVVAVERLLPLTRKRRRSGGR